MISVTHFAFENIAISKVHAAQDGGDQDGGQGQVRSMMLCFNVFNVWWRSPCCAGDQLSNICYDCFFFSSISHNRLDSGLLNDSESFVKKLWRRTRLGQCLWCTRSNFLRSRTHWSQGAWKKLSSRPACQIFQQWLPAFIGKRHDHHHNHHHHHHLSSGMWYLGLHNHIF